MTYDNEKVENISMEMDYNEISKALKTAIGDHFKYRLQRPEILNRIGENLVIFDYIRESVAEGIFIKMLNRVFDNLKDTHDVLVEVDNAAMRVLQKACLTNLDMGGRGIGNQLEDVFINPLSRVLFQLHAKEGDEILIQDIVQDGIQWELKAIKKSI